MTISEALLIGWALLQLAVFAAAVVHGLCTREEDI